MRFALFRTLRLTCAALLLAGTFTAARAEFNPTPIPENAYWELVERSRAQTEKLEGASAAEIRAAAAPLAKEWRSVTAVQMEDGRTLPVHHGLLLRQLQSPKPDTKKIVEALDALLAARAEYPRAVFSAAEIDPLREILARPEFQRQTDEQPNPVSDWFDEQWDRFMRWLDGIFSELGIPSLPILPWLAAVLLAVMLFFAFRTLLLDLALEGRMSEEEEEGEPLTSAAAFEKAQTLSRGGDYRSAVRYLYLSSLLLLDERNILRYDRSKTNREYLRSVAHAPELAQPLGEVIEVFDDTWYGYHELDEQAFQHYSRRVEELKGAKK